MAGVYCLGAWGVGFGQRGSPGRSRGTLWTGGSHRWVLRRPQRIRSRVRAALLDFLSPGYGLAFYFLSLALKSIPVGIAYAVWAGLGIVLVAAIAWIFHGQKLDLWAFVGMGLIVSGVAVLNLLSKVSAH